MELVWMSLEQSWVDPGQSERRDHTTQGETVSWLMESAPSPIASCFWSLRGDL